MKYFNVHMINQALISIRLSNNHQEHVTSRATSGLIYNYFPLGRFSVTPEQIQEYNYKRPDYSIEKFIPARPWNSCFAPHCFVEVKSVVGKSIEEAVDQLHSSILFSMDDWGNFSGSFSTFLIVMRGTRIAFYVYHSFAPLLDDYQIRNYHGIIPLTDKIPENSLRLLNRNHPLNHAIYERYERGMNFPTDPYILANLGVQGTDSIRYPHVFDLLNTNHREYIHMMFQYVANNTADIAASVG